MQRQVVRSGLVDKDKKKRFRRKFQPKRDSDEEDLIKMRPKNPLEAQAMRIDLLFKKNAELTVDGESVVTTIKTLEPGADLLDTNQPKYPKTEPKYTIDLDGILKFML
jgi:hypothetical protein